MNIDVTAILADDEPLLRYHLRKSLEDCWPELNIVGEADNGLSALELVQTKKPDVVFLDIKMPQMDGMQVAKKLTLSTSTTKVVFVTAYDEYAVRAFEANAIDYLLKPYSEQRLEQCIEKLKLGLVKNDNTPSPDMTLLLEQVQQLTTAHRPSYLNWVKAAKGDDIHLIPISEVLYFKAEDKYISLYKQENGQTLEFLLRTSLKELSGQLDPEQFWQIHRSVIVNVSAIDKVRRDMTGKMLVMVQSHSLPVSRAMQGKFAPKLGE